MKTTQPNFEKVKTELYNAALNYKGADMNILLEQVAMGRLIPNFHDRKKEFKKELNSWLNGVDIRCVGHLINVTKELGGKLPSWMVEKKFVIDYNQHGELDLFKCAFVRQSY